MTLIKPIETERAARDSGAGEATIDAVGSPSLPAIASQQSDAVLLNLQPQAANVVWTYAEWTELCKHLNNDNGDRRFVMGFRTHGLKQYVRSKTITADYAIAWGWNSIRGKAKMHMAFTPYSMNNRKQSRWGALDFDAHNGEHERAWTFAFAAFRELRNRVPFIILESSGAGWHVWAISPEFHPVGWWTRLLKTVAHSIDAPIRDGVCEIFPPDTLPEDSDYGRAMRAPGSWNPGTETPNQIYWQNIKDLSSQLTDKRKKFLSIPGGAGAGDVGRDRHSASEGTSLYRAWDENWSAKYGITLRSTRNDQLCKLVGEMFYQVGYDMARRIADEQFQSKKVTTVATLSTHLEAFCNLWCGLQRSWLAGLTPAEKACFDSLETENLRDAFRIVRSYQRWAAETGEPDFAVATQDLGNRLGISPAGGSNIRKALVSRGVIQETVAYQPNRRAARFKWICDTVV